MLVLDEHLSNYKRGGGWIVVEEIFKLFAEIKEWISKKEIIAWIKKELGTRDFYKENFLGLIGRKTLTTRDFDSILFNHF